MDLQPRLLKAMPLAFPSLSHGQVAFGFFHIETPLLLLDARLFWCRDFCALVERLRVADGPCETTLDGWLAHDLGDLHGALSGRHYSGLIGALYTLEPFPVERAAFRQKVAAALPEATVMAELARFAAPQRFAVVADPAGGRLAIGDALFDAATVRRLVDYAWRGGMPGWDGVRRPECLEAAAARWRGDPSPWLAGLAFDPAAIGVP